LKGFLLSVCWVWPGDGEKIDGMVVWRSLELEGVVDIMLLPAQVLAAEERREGVVGALVGFREQAVHSCMFESFGKAPGRLGSRHVSHR